MGFCGRSCYALNSVRTTFYAGREAAQRSTTLKEGVLTKSFSLGLFRARTPGSKSLNL